MSEVETIEQTLAYQLGRLAAFKEVMEGLAHRAISHNSIPNIANATECLLIANELIKPLWVDASREASGLHVAGLEHRA